MGVERLELDDPAAVWQPHGPAVNAAGDLLDARHRTQGQKRQRIAARKRRPKRKAHGDDPSAATRCRRAPLSPKRPRGEGENLPDGVVELAQAAETRGERDLSDGQRRRLEQDPCRLRALRARQGQRPRAHDGNELTMDMP